MKDRTDAKPNLTHLNFISASDTVEKNYWVLDNGPGSPWMDEDESARF